VLALQTVVQPSSLGIQVVAFLHEREVRFEDCQARVGRFVAATRELIELHQHARRGAETKRSLQGSAR
jgi:hypothetical protein